ncbi:hypothetical protein KFL_000230290 [Klebsormidium nitens]|uniref:Uncharacterized protein n=1 Tax=Klebsormidium nitens TaxID=105231 RepID=A0A1Y1HKE4_KLENI|nr:hypothetical protein KFL_000230290 [Klebsormidium nitens]|eukprot:GAQ79050.1 hypothetical protein KFL_000230290 [Klebsormidium nitens]
MAEQTSTTPSILSFFPPAAAAVTPGGNGAANVQPAGTSAPVAGSVPAATPPMFNLKQFAFAANGSHRADAFSPETGKALAATPTTGSELIEELRSTNKKLEAENSKLKTENASLKRKLNSNQGAGAGSAAVAGPPAKKQKPVDGNKLFAKWGKALVKAVPREKFDNCDWGGQSKKVVVTEQGMLQEIFMALFDGKGVLIQPTKDNKLTSVVTIRRFDTFDAVQELFGAQNI